MNNAQIPTIGRTVHYVLSAGPNKGQHRPAAIVNVVDAGRGVCDLVVHTNGTKDGYLNHVTSIAAHDIEQDDAGRIATWHWPEREETSETSEDAVEVEASAVEESTSAASAEAPAEAEAAQS